MVTEDDDLVAAGLVQLLQVVARHVLCWVVEVQCFLQTTSVPSLASLLVVFLVKLGSHLTPYLDALDAGEIATRH